MDLPAYLLVALHLPVPCAHPWVDWEPLVHAKSDLCTSSLSAATALAEDTLSLMFLEVSRTSLLDQLMERPHKLFMEMAVTLLILGLLLMVLLLPLMVLLLPLMVLLLPLMVLLLLLMVLLLMVLLLILRNQCTHLLLPLE